MSRWVGERQRERPPSSLPRAPALVLFSVERAESVQRARGPVAWRRFEGLYAGELFLSLARLLSPGEWCSRSLIESPF